MNILITGATGFLGTALSTQLAADGHFLTRISSTNADLTRTESLNQFNGLAYDQIFHLAAWTRAGDFSLHHSGEQWIINQQINTNVLSWWQKSQPQAKLISMGTSCVYAPDQPLIEENYFVGLPIDSLFTYAMTKRILYAGQLALQKQYGLKHLCLVPSTLYGSDYHTDGRQMHFIFDLIRKIMRGKLHGEPVTLWGDGYQQRELVFLDDFVKIMLRLTLACENELINVGAGEEFTIRYFAQLICEKVGFDYNAIRFDTNCYVGAKSKCLNTNKLQRLIPDLKLTPLDVGLNKTIDWFWEQRENLMNLI